MIFLEHREEKLPGGLGHIFVIFIVFQAIESAKRNEKNVKVVSRFFAIFF